MTHDKSWDWFVEPAPPLSEVGIVREPRGGQRRGIAKGLAIVKAARKAGLQVKGATIEGVALEFGDQAAAPAKLTPLQEWRAKRNARSA